VLESGRRLLVLLPLLIGAGTNCVLAADQAAIGSTVVDLMPGADGLSCPMDEGGLIAGTCDQALAVAAGHLLAPSLDVTDISSSSGSQSLPAAPKSILMVLFGFLCVSLVRDARIWLAVAASVVSLGDCRSTARAASPCYQRGERRFADPAWSHVLPMVRERIPLGVCLCPLPPANLRSQNHADPPDAGIMVLPPARDPLLPCLTSDANPSWLNSSPLAFVLLPRGPPRWA